MKRTRLVEERLRRRWTLKDAAAHLCVSHHTVCAWEQGRMTPHAHNITQLCDIYGVSAQELQLECEAPQEPQRNLVITTGTAMTDNVSSNLQQDLTVRLMNIVWRWTQYDRCEELQNQIDQTVTDYSDIIDSDFDQIMTRRNALRSLVLLPVEACGLGIVSQARQNARDVLVHCAAGIAACWYFRKGKELTLANDALSLYIPALSAIVDTPLHKKAAAALLVQCFLLKATLARHIESSDASIAYLQQAIKYSDISENQLLRILAWRTMAASLLYASRYDQALSAFERSKSLLELSKSGGIAPMVSSYVYAGVATMQAQLGKRDSALASLRMAHKLFAAQSGEAVPIWVDHHMPNLLLNDGLTHHHLGMQRQALDSFTQMDALGNKSEMIRVESLIDRAMAEVNRDDRPRDLDYCVRYWTAGVQGAKELRSEQWLGEARSVYTMLRAAWPAEQRVKDLRELMVHW